MTSTSTGFEQPTWRWPEDLPGAWADDAQSTEHVSQKQQKDFTQDEEPAHTFSTRPTEAFASSSTPGSDGAQNDAPRTYPARTCRICLTPVHATTHMPSDNIPGVFRSRPTVTYEDEDGRLIKPCLCKGTQKYVHEGCLNAWRLQNPMEKRNYWQCPTCKYNYRLERMAWGRWISSTASQVALTLAIFTLATFFLGFFADPILNLYIDPYGTIADLPTHGTEALYEEEPVSWIEHFIKGMASLGLLGFGKFLLTLSPWQWFNVRGSGVMGGGGRRAANNGRDRLRQVSWVAVVVGIVTVLVALWKGVRAWSRKTLENWSEKVMDVPGGDDDEDE